MGKGLLMVLGFLIILMGLAPFLVTWGYMPVALSFVPIAGTTYNAIVIVLGALVIWASRRY